MSAPECDHVFERAVVRHRDGTPMPHGRRCRCGLEVVGGGGGVEGVIPVNASIIRAGREFNLAMGKAAQQMARAMEESRRRRFP